MRLPPTVALAAAALAVSACSNTVKEDFLADIRDGDSFIEPEVTDDAIADADDADDATGDATTTPTDATTAPTDTATTDTGPDDTAVADTTPFDTTAPDVTIPPEADAAFGWSQRLPASPATTQVGPPVVHPGGVLVATGSDSAITLRAYAEDGAPQWAKAAISGTDIELGGAAVCDGAFYVSATETDDSKAFVSRLGTGGSDLRQLTFFPKAGEIGAVSVGPVRCGGPGAYFLFDPIGPVTYKAPAGGTVQLTAEYTQNRNFIVDAINAFGAVGTLSSVSATSMGVVFTAPGAGENLFYVGRARAPRQLGNTAIAVGDELVYAHDYAAETGGTATNKGFLADKAVTAIAGHPSDGRFAVAWTAPAVAYVTAFDAAGVEIGTATLPAAKVVDRIRWAGDDLVVAGPSWLGVIEVSSAMVVAREVALESVTAVLSDLARVTTSGDCAGDGWALFVRDPSSARVVALADSGAACASANLAIAGEGGSGTFAAALLDPSGEWVVTSAGGVRMQVVGDPSIAPWPASTVPFIGAVRARPVASVTP